jgi:branched-chain amino acid transport system permease protein
MVFVGLELMVTYSRMGKAMRAVSQNIECCAIVGIDVPGVALRTFILGAGLAALSGVLTAPVNVNVYGGMGEIVTFKTLPIIIMGGLGNVRGTFFAAMILGIAESLVATYVGLQFRDTVGFATLMLVLMWRPHGLFSAQARF